MKFVSGLRQVGGFFGYSSFLHQWNWPPRYTWNIFASGIKHHNPNPVLATTLCHSLLVICNRSVVFSGFLHQWNWPPRYYWNIVESGTKHYNPHPKPLTHIIKCTLKFVNLHELRTTHDAALVTTVLTVIFCITAPQIWDTHFVFTAEVTRITVTGIWKQKKTPLTGLGSHFISLTLPHVCACPKPGLGFPSFVVVFFVFSEFS